MLRKGGQVEVSNRNNGDMLKNRSALGTLSAKGTPPQMQLYRNWLHLNDEGTGRVSREIGDKAQQSPTSHGLFISSVCELEKLWNFMERHGVPHFVIHSTFQDGPNRLT